MSTHLWPASEKKLVEDAAKRERKREKELVLEGHKAYPRKIRIRRHNFRRSFTTHVTPHGWVQLPAGIYYTLEAEYQI